MKKIIVVFFFISFALFTFAQVKVPAEIERIISKMSNGRELTEREETQLERWSESAEEFYAHPDKAPSESKVKNRADRSTNSLCPPKIVLGNSTELNKEKYVELAQSLMTLYGPITGDLLKLKQVLQQSAKKSDGSDLGAAYVMTGAGSASIYAIAWSAAQAPDDILTANNLGVALKDMGEYAKAIQV